MKTEDQIKDIIHGAEQRIRDIAERERQWFESGFASKMEDALSRVRAQLTAPDPGVVHGQKPALVLCHAIKTYKSDEPRRISVVELRTSYGPNYQLDFSSARLHDDDEPTPIKPGKRYLVSIAFYELPGDEP